MDSYSGNILRLYREYIEWSRELMGSYGGVKMFAQLFTGGAEYKNRPEHMDFFRAVEKAAGEYMDAFMEGRLERESLFELLSYVLLDCHNECDDWADWMLMAVEKSFLPFVELLSGQEAAKLYEPYRKLRRKNKGLPPQDEMLKKLKKKKF